MTGDTQKKSIRDVVLEKIKTGQARMRPRWHFILKTLLGIFGLIIVAAALLYTASFIIFVLRQSGIWFIPIFGFFGIRIFLFSLPWLLILTGFIFIILLEILVRHFAFAYRKPLLYSLVGIIIFVVAASFLVSRTKFHDDFFLRAREGRLPIAGRLYRGYGMQKNKNVHPGIIKEITEDGFQMENFHEETLKILITPETRLSAGINFQKGDRVVIFGERDDHTIKALGIRKIYENAREPFIDQGRYRLMR